MAENKTSAGKKATAAPRVAPLKIFAARKALDATDSISASLCVGAQLKLTIRDYYTGQPVKKARAKRVDVEHFKDSHGALATADQEFFDLPYPAPEYAPAFTAKDEEALKKADQELEKIENDITGKKAVDFKAMSKSLDQRETLVQKRRLRLEWCRFMQCAVTILTGWRSDKPYTGPHDGSNWDQFEKEFLAPVYRAVTGRAYDDAKNRFRTAAAELQEAIARVFITDDDGVLLIPLPVGHTGKITLEMTHLKLLAPADAAKLGPVSGIRAEYERSANDFKADEPGSTVETSRWKLVSDKHAANLRNFISIGYDTTSEKAVQEPQLIETFAMVWCQPTWFETTSKGIAFELGNTATDKRGMKNGAPTFTVSSSRTGRGRWYGSWGDKGRGDPVDFSQHVAEDPPKSGQWYWFKQKDKKDVLITDWDNSKKELEKRSREFDPSAYYQNQFRIVRPGTGVQTVAGIGDVDLKSNKAFAYVREWYRDAVAAASYEEAMVAAAAQASGGKELLERAPSGKWRVRRPPDSYNQYGQTEEFATIQEAINVGLARKMHHGIDCAGDVGDPVFAVCGGTISHGGKEIYNSSSNAGGLSVNLGPWMQTEFSLIQYLHNQQVLGKPGLAGKAGDVIAIMGRTGNPVADSPTHTHFHVFKSGQNMDLSTCALSDYEEISPWNGQPKLLPCAADWHTSTSENSKAPPQPNNQDPVVPRRCRGLPDERANKSNSVPNECWALKQNCCPHLTSEEWLEIKAADAAEKAARQKEEAARKLQEQKEKKNAAAKPK